MRAKRTLITADRVWTGTGGDIIQQGFVLADGATIAAMGRIADLGSGADDGERIELHDATLLPGLINAHVHLVFTASMTPVDDFLADQAQGTDAMISTATANLEAAATVGVTTVRDLGGPNDVVLAVREAAAEGRIAGGSVVAAGSPITRTGGHCHWFSYCCDSTEEVLAAVAAQAAVGADLVKIFVTGGNLTPGSDPFALQYEADRVAGCVMEARAHGMPVAAHAHAPAGIRAAAVAGVCTIEHGFFETPESVEFDPETAELMAANDIAVVPTFGAGVLRLMSTPPEELAPVPRRLAGKSRLILAALRATKAAGVTLVSGSDAGIPNRATQSFLPTSPPQHDPTPCT